MYFLYAELLLLAGKAADAMPYYELAAYDGEGSYSFEITAESQNDADSDCRNHQHSDTES